MPQIIQDKRKKDLMKGIDLRKKYMIYRIESKIKKKGYIKKRKMCRIYMKILLDMSLDAGKWQKL